MVNEEILFLPQITQISTNSIDFLNELHKFLSAFGRFVELWHLNLSYFVEFVAFLFLELMYLLLVSDFKIRVVTHKHIDINVARPSKYKWK